MFSDIRFGTRTAIPAAARIRPVMLSHARVLFFRLASPHEREESLAHFLSIIDDLLRTGWAHGWRVNIACAMQPNETGTTPDLVAICEEIHKQFHPERIRVAQLDPQQDGDPGVQLTRGQVDRLWRIWAEVLTIDGRRHGQLRNGMLLADFFDFT